MTETMWIILMGIVLVAAFMWGWQAARSKNKSEEDANEKAKALYNKVLKSVISVMKDPIETIISQGIHHEIITTNKYCKDLEAKSCGRDCGNRKPTSVINEEKLNRIGEKFYISNLEDSKVQIEPCDCATGCEACQTAQDEQDATEAEEEVEEEQTIQTIEEDDVLKFGNGINLCPSCDTEPCDKRVIFPMTRSVRGCTGYNERPDDIESVTDANKEAAEKMKAATKKAAEESIDK